MNIFSIVTSSEYVNKNYCGYFQPEIKRFLTKENIEKYGSKNKSLQDDKFIERMNKEVEANFYKKRREGLNNDDLCKLIRNNEILSEAICHLKLTLKNQFLKQTNF